MNNEFEKLDAFMKKHTPPVLEAKVVRPKTNQAWKGFALASALSVVVIVAVQMKQKTYDENTLALSEVMEWDVTSDEMPADVEDLIAWSE